MREFITVVVPGEGEVPDGGESRVATLLLSRPPTNALTRQMNREIADAVTEIGARDDVCAVIVFGGHEIFSVGADVPELKTLDTGGVAAADAVSAQAVAALAALPKPTVAAITGYALGAGMTLALAADWRISGDNVKFGATEILAGLAPAGDGAGRLAEAVGPSRARDLVFSGRFVDAREAHALGLVDELVAPDAVYDAASTWARRFLEHPPEVLAAAKAAFAAPRSTVGS